MKLNLFFKLFLLLFSSLAFSGEAVAQTNCTSIPAPQFAQSTNASLNMNGVTVTRRLTRALYSPATSNTTATPQCTPTLAAGYAWLRAEDTATSQSVTYTFSQPQTSVQIFLLLMGNAGQPYSADMANFSVNNGGSLTITKNPNNSTIDCRDKINISGNTVQVTNLANNTTNGAVLVTSSVAFTTLTITNPRSNRYGSTTDGYGYFVELCPSSVKCVAPAVPTLTVKAATCTAAGTATITNYSSSNTYTFTPAGPTVGAGGVISNLTAETSYTVQAASNTCISAASAHSSAFLVAAQLSIPKITGSVTASKGSTSQLSGSGTKATTNPWVSSNNAVATVSANGLVKGVMPGTATVTYTNNVGCSAQVTFTVTALQNDWDGDGVVDATDLDDDNDGILDDTEMYCDQTVAPNGTFPVLNSPGTTPLYAKQLLFFDWSGVTLNSTNTTATRTVVHNGVTYTAAISRYTGTGIMAGADISVYNPAAATQMIGKYYNVNGASFKEMLYSNTFTGENKFTVAITATKTGISYPVTVVVFDPETTNNAAGNVEKLAYITDGSDFTLLERTGVSASQLQNNITLSNNNKTVTYINTQNNSATNVGPVNALYQTTGVGVTINASAMGANSNQGIGFAVRLYCDTDGDAVPNFLDTDSDNDGCPDATEGANRYATSGSLPGGSNGGSTANLGTAVNANGIPTAAGAGQATTDGVRIPVIINAGTTPPATMSINTGVTVTLTSNATAETTSVWNTSSPFEPNYSTTGNATGELTYSWTKNGVTIEGVTGAALTLNNVTPANAAGTYVVTIRHPNNYCGTTKQTVLTVNDVCYISPNTAGAPVPSKHGITLLKRAGADNGNWPMIRSSAHTVLEANAKGFVITRMSTAEINDINTPQDGMMVYDSDVNCLKIYDGSGSGWSCFSKPACP